MIFFTFNVSSDFTDVEETYEYKTAVDYVKNKGIIKGYKDGNFKPANNIKFVEAAKIIINAFEYKLEDKTKEETGEDWYTPFVNKISSYGAIPISINELDLEIYRGEMAEMIWRIKDEKRNQNQMRFEKGKPELQEISKTIIQSDSTKISGFEFGFETKIEAKGSEFPEQLELEKFLEKLFFI